MTGGARATPVCRTSRTVG